MSLPLGGDTLFVYHVGMDDDFDDDELEELDLPETEPTVSFLVSQFFIEMDRKEKKVNHDVVRALDKLFDKHGEDYTAVSVMNYLGRRKGWDMEILAEKHEVEDLLLNKYNIFDDGIWSKILGTEAMFDLRKKIFSLSQTYLDRAVLEVLGKEQPDIPPMGDPLL